MVLQQLGKLPEENATLSARRVQTPDGIKSFLGSIDGNVDILGSGFGNSGGDLSVC